MAYTCIFHYIKQWCSTESDFIYQKILAVLKTFLVVLTGGGEGLAAGMQSRDAVKHPTMNRALLTTKNYPAPNVKSFPRLRNPEIRKSEGHSVVLPVYISKHMLLYYTKI